MEIWLDSIDLNTIAEAASMGWVHGITTNPAIISSSKDPEILFKLLNLWDKTIAVQVTGTTTEEMIKEAKHLCSFSERLLIKVPVNKEGLKAIYSLNQNGIPTLGTAVFTLRQAFLAAKAGATYVAPYLSHITKQGFDAFNILSAMQDLFKTQNLETKIMSAAIKEVHDVMQSAQIGIPAATLPADLFLAFIDNDSFSDAATLMLHKKWSDAFGKLSITDLSKETSLK